MGYMDFSKKRYWDARESDSVSKKLVPAKGFVLPSDSTNRKDSGLLRKGQSDAAQEAKEEIEILQRHDRKLREACAQRRE